MEVDGATARANPTMADAVNAVLGARGLAKAGNAVVVCVDYRFAPENRFPAAWDD